MNKRFNAVEDEGTGEVQACKTKAKGAAGEKVAASLQWSRRDSSEGITGTEKDRRREEGKPERISQVVAQRNQAEGPPPGKRCQLSPRSCTLHLLCAPPSTPHAAHYLPESNIVIAEYHSVKTSALPPFLTFQNRTCLWN